MRVATSSITSWSCVTKQHGAVIFLQRDIQRVDGFEIEVVRRLVENQHIWLLQHQSAENQPRGFASGKSAGGFSASSPLKSIWPSRPRNSSCVAMRIEFVEPVDHGGALYDRFGVVLREVADGDVVAPGDRAAINRELLFRIAR